MLYAHPFLKVVDKVLTYFSFIAIVNETYKILVFVGDNTSKLSNTAELLHPI